MINWQTATATKLMGTIKVPGDKSISHRSIMLGALAEGRTEISGFLQGEDCIATRKAFEAMGVNIRDEANKIIIEGVGMHGLSTPKSAIDLGNSGTGMRLLAGLLVGQSFSSTLVGDHSLMTRPMRRIAEPLTQMGANISTTENGCAPLEISPAKALTGISYSQPVTSAQVKSSILLAGMYGKGKTVITEPGISRDHTERMLQSFGYEVEVDGANRTVSLIGGGKLTGREIVVPADISSAAFFMVAGLIAKDADITLEAVGVNPTRTGIIDILKRMGADLTLEKERLLGAEPVADIRVKSSSLKGIEVPQHLVPLAIDEFPVIFVAAACATGKFILRGAKELRVKESDRIEAMAVGLTALGINCEVLEDGIIIEGGQMHSAEVDSFTDHRIAMAFAVAGIRAESILIKDCDNVATSFPNFFQLSEQIGMDLTASLGHYDC